MKTCARRCQNRQKLDSMEENPAAEVVVSALPTFACTAKQAKKGSHAHQREGLKDSLTINGIQCVSLLVKCFNDGENLAIA